MNKKSIARWTLSAICFLILFRLGGWNAIYTLVIGLLLYFLFLVFEDWVDSCDNEPKV